MVFLKLIVLLFGKWLLVTKVHATAALGGIIIDAVSSSWSTTIYNPVEILSVSGPINWLNSTSTDGIGVFRTGGISFGSKFGVTGLTSSSSNITINIHRLSSSTSPFAIATSGQVNIIGVNGTTSFDQALNTSLFGLNANSQTMTGFTFGSSSNSQNLTFDQTLTVAGPVTTFGGTVTLNENISSSNGSTISLFCNGLTFASGKTVTSTGQLIVAPQAASNTIGLAGASGTLQLPASYFSTNFTDGFSNIQIGSNSQTGTISSNAFTLRDNMTFLTSGSLILGGRPVLGSNDVTLGSGISSISASASGYFQTNGSGKVIRTIANASNFQFPVGNTAFNPVSISNNNSASDVFGVRVLDEVYKDGTTGSALTSKPRIKRTWDITKSTANNGGVNFIFNWNNGEEDNLSSGHALFHYGSNWDEQIGSTSVSGTTLSYTGYTGTFSPFAIGSNLTPLPVDLVSFDATPNNNTVDLTWTTFGDNRNPFNILKSTDGVTWNPIGILNTTDNNVHYLFTDHKPAPVNYYQLSQLDNNNTLQYSDIRVVDFNGNTLSVFPNPNNGDFTIQSNHVVQFQISDYTGKVIMEGDNTNPLIKSNLLKGIYFIKISDGDQITFNKIIVQ